PCLVGASGPSRAHATRFRRRRAVPLRPRSGRFRTRPPLRRRRRPPSASSSAWNLLPLFRYPCVRCAHPAPERPGHFRSHCRHRANAPGTGAPLGCHVRRCRPLFYGRCRRVNSRRPPGLLLVLAWVLPQASLITIFGAHPSNVGGFGTSFPPTWKVFTQITSGRLLIASRRGPALLRFRSRRRQSAL